MQNYLSTKSFILFIGFKNNLIFSFFPIVKIVADYAGFYTVGKLESGFH